MATVAYSEKARGNSDMKDGYKIQLTAEDITAIKASTSDSSETTFLDLKITIPIARPAMLNISLIGSEVAALIVSMPNGIPIAAMTRLIIMSSSDVEFPAI